MQGVTCRTDELRLRSNKKNPAASDQTGPMGPEGQVESILSFI